MEPRLESGRAFCTLMLCGLLGCGGTGTGAPAELDADQTEAEVSAFLDTYLGALETRDAEAVSEQYVTDGRFEWIEDGEIRYRSAADVLAGLESLPADMAIVTEYQDRVITPVGDRGAKLSTRFRTVIGEGPGSFSFGGMMTMVLEHGPTGWRVVSGHTSSPRQDGR